MKDTFKRRLQRLESVLGADDDVVGAIIISVVSGRTDAPERDDDRDCIGLRSTSGGNRVIVRNAGESLEDLDARASAERLPNGGVAVWVRQYRGAHDTEH